MSEQYLVSARKYRPKNFESVVGQSHITTTLKNAIKNNHLAHAYLFCGPRGVGKTSCARILAKTINCEAPTPEMEACGTCPTCVAFQENSAFNVFELDAASNNSVDDIRELVEQVRFAPTIGKYKIYIIDEVHMLSAQAFNAFLKTLEEPPHYAVFILATTEKQKILPTILSRCQIFEFKRIQTQDIVIHLANICLHEKVKAENSALHMIAQKSEGCMRDALSIMDKVAGFGNGIITYDQTIEHLNILDAKTYFKLVDALMTTDIAAVMLMIDQLFKAGFEGDTILNGFAANLRDLMLCKDKEMSVLLDIPEDYKSEYFQKAQLLPLEFIISGLNLLNDAEQQYKAALNKRLHLEMCFIKLCYLNNALNHYENNEVKKKHLANTTVGVASSRNAIPKMPIVTVDNTPTKKADTYNPSMLHATNPVNKPIDRIVAPPDLKQKESTIVMQSEAENITVKESDKDYIKQKAPNAIPKPKLGQSFLDNIHQQAAAALGEQEEIPMTLPLLQELYDRYKEEMLVQKGHMLMATNLSMVTVDIAPTGEVILNCKSTISQIYALKQSESIRDFFRKELKNRTILVQVLLTVSEREEVKNTVLTKAELYEKLVSKNAAIKMLRDNLHLDI